MADTQFIKREVEPFLRIWLAAQYGGQRFEERPVRRFRFDAVSEDGSVVAQFLCNRPKTASGNENSGAVKKALNDIRTLQFLPINRTRLAIFTDPGFLELVKRRSQRFDPDGIDFIHCPLPEDLQARLCANLDACREEQRSRIRAVSRIPETVARAVAQDVLPIKLVPPNEANFKEAVRRSGLARISISYKGGRTTTQIWKITRLTRSSSIIGNLRSRKEFRQGEWQRRGMCGVVVTAASDSPAKAHRPHH